MAELEVSVVGNKSASAIIFGAGIKRKFSLLDTLNPADAIDPRRQKGWLTTLIRNRA